MPRRRGRPGTVKPPSRKDLRGRDKHKLKARKVGASITINKEIQLSQQERNYYNQNGVPECCTFSTDQIMTIHYGVTFHCGWGFYRAQERDGIPGENGTTTDAMLRVVRDLGNVVYQGTSAPLTDVVAAPDPKYSIESFDWTSMDPAVAIEQVRSLIASDRPLVFASPWYSSFTYDSEWMDPAGRDWGTPDGQWHQYAITGVLDDAKCLLIPNSWGWGYSHKLSFQGFMRLVREKGQGASVTYTTDPVTPTPEPEPEPTPKPKKKHHRKPKRKPRRR